MNTELSSTTATNTATAAPADNTAPTNTATTTPAVEEPQIKVHAAPNGDNYDQHFDTQLKHLVSYLLAQPTLGLTLSYLFCSLVGMLFVVQLFHKFDFDVLPYVDITDFLLAALSYPWTLLYLIGLLSFLSLMFVLDRKIRQRFRRFASWIDRIYHEKYMPRNLLLYVGTSLMFCYMAADSSAKQLARHVKNNNTPLLQLNLVYPMQDLHKSQALQPVQLIARTSGYLFIYHQQQVKVIPHTNVAALLPYRAQPASTVPHSTVHQPAAADQAAAPKKSASQMP